MGVGDACVLCKRSKSSSRARNGNARVVEGAERPRYGRLYYALSRSLRSARRSGGGSRRSRSTTGRVTIKVGPGVRPKRWTVSCGCFDRLPGVVNWADGGLTPDDAVTLGKVLKDVGLDYIDVSSGGVTAEIRTPTSQGYNVPIARRLRRG